MKEIRFVKSEFLHILSILLDFRIFDRMGIPFLTTSFFADGLTFALREATVPGLAVVVVLLMVSSYSWSVMVTKYRSLSRATKSSHEFLGQWRDSKSPLELYAKGTRFETSPHYRVYYEGCEALTTELLGEAVVDETLPQRLTKAGKISPLQMETVQLSMHKAVGETALRLESQTALLATAVSGGPFLGLLGTVWGVMDTFSGIASSTSSASVKDMAPGVAAALVTTVVGLLVAIPAMFGYNWLVNRVRTMVVSLENFSVELAASMNRSWLDTGRPWSRPSPDWATAFEDSMVEISPPVEKPVPVKDSPTPTHAAAAAPAPLEMASLADAQSPRNRTVDPESGMSEDY